MSSKRLTRMLLCLLAVSPSTIFALDCPIKLGGVLPLTGSLGAVGEPIAETAQMAVDHLNEAGGVKGCQIKFLLRDTQGQSAVGVDAAKSLVEVEGVPALVGAVSSGVSLPILTSVAVPSKVTQVSCCSTSPTFSQLAAEGKTEGLWFRTYPTSRTLGVASAKLAIDQGYKKIAAVYVNTDFGVNIYKEFKQALQAFGGEVAIGVAYNEEQPSYRAEVNQALAAQADALYLAAFPADGATIAREWLSFGGSQKIILHNALRSNEFINNVGAQYLTEAIGLDNGQVDDPSVAAFNQDWAARFGAPPAGPGLHAVYDAVVVIALAMAAVEGDSLSGPAIAEKIRTVLTPDGAVVRPGVAGLKDALAKIAAGETVRYIGATGPLQFDPLGNVSGPVVVWNVNADGSLGEQATISVDDMNLLFQQVDSAK